MKFPPRVKIIEVGPRDGLQNESTSLNISSKVAFIQQLADTGLSAIECGSFVSPRWVPQMANSAEVFSSIVRKPGVVYSGLVPNLQGLTAAKQHKVEEVAVFSSASESFSKQNVNCSIDESLAQIQTVVTSASASGIRVRGYVSCVLGCPFENQVAVPAVVRVATALFRMGCYEISLGDTIGTGTPRAVQTLIAAVSESVPASNLAVHFHDTYGQALANILAALDVGVSVVDASAAGLGGCPYAPGAAGNAATEDVIYMLNGMSVETGVDLDKLIAAGQAVCRELGRTPQSKVSHAPRSQF